MITFESIKKAQKMLEGVVLKTQTIESRWLGDPIHGRVFLKLENMQMTGSFKPRGAYIKLMSLSDEQRARGVVAMSAGNHAQGVAYHAECMGIPAIIVMPKDTPLAKIENTRRFHPTIILEGNNLSESGVFARQIAEKEGMTLIHPYDDPFIIQGQATVGLEMLEQMEHLDRIDSIIVPIGGGGLAAGLCLAVKALNPSIKIYGVQSAYCPAMAAILYPHKEITRESINGSPLAEGISVKAPGDLTQAILKEHLEDILIVTESEIEAAIETLLLRVKTLAEGAGAAGVAALQKNSELFHGQNVGVVVCGGNIDSRLISALTLRALARQEKLCRIHIEISDAPGVLGSISQIIGAAGGNIYEINHQRLFSDITIKMTIVHAVIETRDHEHLLEILKALNDKGFRSYSV